ncbi:uncharacterized protein DNG_00148 [Cephalotrichum gorgonifer]|uniref:Uncharacterized protein n=1 Tax=Cephalotrichum gorgonifer TaxID=2041049 RepID=A0AAE8MPG8_9PEZI|nr:uncharacterized protein DNG_00148 [Cephalotrichum gorgonifer]
MASQEVYQRAHLKELPPPVLHPQALLPSRRIIVSDLPDDIHIYSILKCIHGGPLVSAIVLDTTPVLGRKTALIEFHYPEHATAFLNSIPDRTLVLTSEATGTAASVRVRRLPTSSSCAPRRISALMKNGVSRLLVVRNFLRRQIYPFLVEANLHRGRGLQSLVEVSYTEAEGLTGVGRLSLEFASVKAAFMAQSILVRLPGLLRSRFPSSPPHFYDRDPCQREADASPAGPLDLPENVKDPVRFFTLHEFLAPAPYPRLPNPNCQLVSTGLVTTTLHSEDFSPFSPAFCPVRYAEKEHHVRPWTHVDPETGAHRVKFPFGWKMTVEDWWKDVIGRHLETDDPKGQRVVDSYFEASGNVNLRNKLYVVTFDECRFLARVTTWGDPIWRIESEVAILKWINENTSVQVPVVISQNFHRLDDVNFEWIIMENIEGTTLVSIWRGLHLFEKQDLVRRVVSFYAELFQHRICGIRCLSQVLKILSAPPSAKVPKVPVAGPSCKTRGGGDNPGISAPPPLSLYCLGMLVSETYKGPKDDFLRGPFHSSRDWISAKLDVGEAIFRKRPGDIPDLRSPRDEKKNLFPEGGPPAEPSVVTHPNLKTRDLLVDGSGNIPGIVGRQFASAMPFPAITDCHHEDGKVAENYKDDLEEYELTRLRETFLWQMRRLQPDWVRIFESWRRHRAFWLATEACSSGWTGDPIPDLLTHTEGIADGTEVSGK